MENEVPLTLGSLPMNDVAKAVELARSLQMSGDLLPEYMSMILRSQEDPTELLARFKAEGIEAKTRR